LRLQLATVLGRADWDNEDFAAATPGLLVLLDGAGTPSGLDTGCVHSVAWYARTLGGLFLAEATDRTRSLSDALAAAITTTNARHAGTCDLGNSGTPSATVVAVRLAGESLDYLVLCDSVLIVERAMQAPLVITDDRLERLRDGLDSPEVFALLGTDEHAVAVLSEVEKFARLRNRPGGFWVASTNPAAARQALTGSIPLADVTAVTLLSDGATRLVDRFGLLGWADVLAILREDGPDELLRRTRKAEARDPHGRRWPRGKASDDATVVYLALAD
jgi:Protein phosphatase 2C